MYEINERDRGSPAYLRLSQKSVNSLGDLVPFSNKACSSSPTHPLNSFEVKYMDEKEKNHGLPFLFFFLNHLTILAVT